MGREPAPNDSGDTIEQEPDRRAVILGGSDVTRTIGRPGLLERAGAVEVVREVPTRFDVMVQRLEGSAVAPPADLPPTLTTWFQSMVSSAAQADDVGLVVMSLRHELLGPERGEGRQRMLVASVAHAGRTWFIKMAGPEKLVQRERDAMLRLVGSLRLVPVHP